MSRSLNLRWVSILDHSDLVHLFITKKNLLQKSKISSGPQIYRFLFESCDGSPAKAYIGETSSFKRRFCEYLSASNSTEKHLRGKVLSADALSLRVSLQTLHFDICQLEGVQIQDLDNCHLRRMLESLTILRDASQGVRIINQEINLRKRDFQRLLGKPITSLNKRYKEQVELFSPLIHRHS